MPNPNIAEEGKPYQFKEGHEPMGGRPKGRQDSKTILKKYLELETNVTAPNGESITGTVFEDIIISAIKQAKDGDIRALKEILDRYEGAVKKEVELSGGLTTTLSESERASRITQILNNGRERGAGQIDSDSTFDTERI